MLDNNSKWVYYTEQEPRSGFGGEKVKIDIRKFELVLARKCLTNSQLKGVSSQTVAKIRRGNELRTDTLGRVARALGVDPTEIMEVNE